MPDPLHPSLPGIHCSLFCLTCLSCTYTGYSNGVAIVEEQATQIIGRKTGEGEKDASSVSEQDSRSFHSQQTICIYPKYHNNPQGKRGRQRLAVRQSWVQLWTWLSASCATVSISLDLLHLLCSLLCTGDDTCLRG